MGTNVVKSVEVGGQGKPAGARPEGERRAAYRAPELHEVGTLRQLQGSTLGKVRDSRPFCVYWNSLR
jgi:hypothetical protein